MSNLYISTVVSLGKETGRSPVLDHTFNAICHDLTFIFFTQNLNFAFTSNEFENRYSALSVVHKQIHAALTQFVCVLIKEH